MNESRFVHGPHYKMALGHILVVFMVLMYIFYTNRVHNVFFTCVHSIFYFEDEG